MVKPMWRLVSVFLALAAFLGVGVVTLIAGEELVWVAAKSVVSFFICWIVLGQLGHVLCVVVEKQEGNLRG